MIELFNDEGASLFFDTPEEALGYQREFNQAEEEYYGNDSCDGYLRHSLSLRESNKNED